MRIFHLVPNLNYGGLQEVVRGLALCQRKAGHSVTIGCWTDKSNHPEAERDLEQAGVRVVHLRFATDRRISLFRRLKGHLGAKNADILHVHNPFGYYIYGATAARVAGGTKIVHTLHATLMFERVKGHNLRREMRLARRKADFWISAMLTDGLVSVCSEVETVLRSKFFLPGHKLFVVENGIDLARFLAVPARCLRDEIVFGAVGRMTSEKNHRALIEAFASARRRHGNIRLRLLGDGPREPELRELVRSLGLDDVVEFRGFSHDVAGFLAGLDVFALPSYSEGLPLTLLEAIASGLPVVATEVGGVPRIVHNTDSGWLCAPENVDALLGAMESAIASSDRRDRGERGRRLVEQYSAERMARDYERLYQRLLP